MDIERQRGYGRTPAAVLIALGSLVAPAAQAQPPTLDAATEILTAAALPVGCPLDDPRDVPTFHAYRTEGAWHVADVAIVVPGSPERIAPWLLDPSTYPAWTLNRPDGEPNLNDVQIDEGKGEGSVRLGKEEWRGTIARTSAGSIRGVRFELADAGRVQAAYVELTLRPATGCADRGSVVTGRVAWKLGWFIRMLAGNMRHIPTLFAVRLRDDILGRALGDPAALAALLGDSIRFGDAAGPPEFTAGDGGSRPARGDRLLRLAPFVIDSPVAAATVERLREEKKKHTFADVLPALRGQYAMVGYLAWIERGARRQFVTVGGTDREATYKIDVIIRTGLEDSSLRMTMAYVDPSAPAAYPRR